MKLGGHAHLQSKVDMQLKGHVEPIPFTASASSAFKASVGPVDAHVGMIPIAVAIPFLRRKPGYRIVVASVGGFDLHVKEVALHVQDATANISGTLGQKDGIGVTADSGMQCNSNLDVDAKINGSKATITVALSEDEGGGDQ
ncbi:MAG: hypothetical protein L6Q76_01780 [Polyangiaceae bacterium]|nr:hypothetical protein [Polyangiaceae bacterium]